MSSAKKSRRLSIREKTIIAGVLLALVSAVAAQQVMRTLDRTKNLTELYQRMLFASSVYLDPDSARRVFDRNLQTSWQENLPSRTLPSVKDDQSPIPDPSSIYLVLEMGLSHYPGEPPIKNPLSKFLIWPGHQAEGSDFRDYARPRAVNLIFFKQKLVDIDRDYQIPGLPYFWGSKRVVLEDRPGVQEINLDFLGSIEDSEKFPINISQIWMRMTVESVYPGRKYKQRMAVSEVDFRQKNKAHIEFRP